MAFPRLILSQLALADVTDLVHQLLTGLKTFHVCHVSPLESFMFMVYVNLTEHSKASREGDYVG